MSKKHRRRTDSRRQLRFQRRSRPGAAPGLVHAPLNAQASRLRVMAIKDSQCQESEVTSVESLPQIVEQNQVTWIDVSGLGDVEMVKRLGQMFDLHPLALEDVVNVHQRAKVEPYKHSIFVISRMPSWEEGRFESEQVSLFVGDKIIFTFQEQSRDWFEGVRERIRKGVGRASQISPGFLAYTLLDTVIDSYFPIVDQLGDQLDDIEETMTRGKTRDVLSQIHALLHELLLIRRTIRPHRDAINELIRDGSGMIRAETMVFLRDCADHTVQLIELLEVYRDMCVDYRDFHLSLISNRMNDIMRGLTLIATVFMPLNFIAAVYGMNFSGSPYNMPELHWRFGYPFALFLMGTVALGTTYWFSKQGWLDKRT